MNINSTHPILSLVKLMRFIFYFFIFNLTLISKSQAEVIPTMLTSSQRQELIPYFSSSYPQQLTTRPYFIGNYPGLEAGISLSYRDLSELQEDYPTDNIRDEMILTQIFLKKSLIHRMELTISTTISSFGTSQISGFGGMLSWYPFDLNDFQILPMVSAYTNFMNFEDSLVFQESGLHLGLGKNFKFFSIKAGLSLSQFSARFYGSSNGKQITDTNSTEKESALVQTYYGSVHLEWNKYFFNFSQNYTINAGWNPTLIVSYQL